MIITACQDAIIMFQQTDSSTTDSDIFWNADLESGLNYVASEKKNISPHALFHNYVGGKMLRAFLSSP